MTLTEIEALITPIEGWFSPEEGKCLYDLAKNCQGEGVIVEIGSWQGKSTVCLANGAKVGRGNKVIAIDPHTGSEEHQAEKEKVWTFDAFQQNIKNAGVEGLVKPIVKMSFEAVEDVTEPIELLFIDGAHDYDSVKQDIKDWFPKLVPNGWIAFHDSDWPGVAQALKEDIYLSSQIRNIRVVLGTTIAQKVENSTASEKRANRFKLWKVSTRRNFKALKKGFKNAN